MQYIRLQIIGLFILMSLLTVGCTPQDLGTKVRGQVLLDGKPLEDGSLTFVGNDGNSQAFAVVKGSYSAYLTPGEKDVYFYAVKVVSERPRNEFPGDTDVIQEFESIIPKKYAAKGATTITVGDKSMQHDFALTDD